VIVEYIRYNIPEERRAAFERGYGQAAAALAASPHCRAYELAHCTEAPDSYILRIEWDSLDGHLHGFRASPEFGAFFQAVRPFVDDIAEMRHYELTHIAARKAAA
jgi:quinol monooxygenase YgiN